MAITYTVSGRIVTPDGAPLPDARVTVKQLADLATGPTNRGADTSDSNGKYLVSWQESAIPSSPWDLFVHADNLAGTVVESHLITDPPTAVTVDIIFGDETYRGRSEWERISTPINEVLNGFAAKDVPPERLEWVCRRADVFPTLVAMYLQAHRLSDARTVKVETCYACLRQGLPGDLVGLLRAGRTAWEGALRTGWQRQITPLPGDGSSSAQDNEVAAELAALDELVVENAVYESATGVNRYDILATGGLTPTEQRTFTQAWLAHTGTLSEFWGDLVTSLGADKVADLQFTLQATTLVGNHLDTLSRLQDERGQANISSVADLASWSQSAWETFLSTPSEIDPPSEITGASTTERRQNYARALRRLIEDAYPTEVLRHRIDAEVQPPTHTTEIVGYFANNPGFDITKTNIAGWVSANPTAFSYATDAQQARADLEIVQRVHRVTPRLGRYETTKALLDNGITSAADIAAHTRDEFREAFSAILPSEHHDPDMLAEAIWDKATHIHASTLAVVSYYALGKSGADPRPLQNMGDYTFSPSGNGLESLDAILGNLDYCACTHCRSVFSPAAYLADLLKFLDDRKADSPYVDALQVLRNRRPDLEHILLDCANTNTVLPQIDLAIELLERKFARELDGSSPQTTWATEQLLAHPEHIVTGVYDNTLPIAGTKLDEYVHPWALPFSLPVLESRTYLRHLGVAREHLMRLLDNGATPSPEAIAAEALGLSGAQWQIISGDWTGNASADDREFWGYPLAESDWVGILSGTHETKGDPGELMRRGGYQLDELRELLDLTFIDPNNYDYITEPSTRIEFSWSETCSLADAEIANFGIAALDRLHRFTRLQRATLLPARTLNVLIEQVGAGVLGEAFLVQLPRIIDLHERTRLDYDVLATWWSDKIDAQAYADGPQSLYQRRFLAPELHASTDFSPTDASGVALDGEADVVLTEADVAVVLSAVRLSAADYAALLTIPGEHVFTTVDRGKFRFRFFAELMRAASFMRAMKLSAKEFVTLMTLFADISKDPFESPTRVFEVIEILDRLRATKLSLSELAWLLRHDFADDHADDEIKVGRALAELVRGLRTIAAETAELVDPDGTATELNLASVIVDENGVTIDNDIDAVMEVLANTSALGDLAKGDLIDTYFASFTDTTTAKAELVTGGGSLGGEVGDAPARYAWVLREFVGSSRRRALLTDLAARELSIEAASAEVLLYDLLSDPGPAQSLARVFLVEFATDEEVVKGLTSSTNPDEFKAWTRLSKAASVVRSLSLEPEVIAGYSDLVDLDGLPLTTLDTKVSVEDWDILLQAIEVRDLFATPDGHQRLEAAVDLDAAIEVLVEDTQWNASELATLLDVSHLNLTTPASLGAPAQLARLRELAAVSAQTGASFLRLWSWIHPVGSELVVANEIKAAARSRHDDAGWAKVAPPLRDEIRVAQRDALVAANLAADASLEDRDALSESLLIDVATSPCMKTSRIKQAISSVQLFIHRAFIRLETDVKLKEEAGDLWTWMKNYRVWEANRKVFLYPENWIVPGLRSDKTPQFKAFESSLMQDTLDEYRVERALSGYLEALDTVSNLEIVGVWSAAQQGPPIKDVWVLGRTQSAPHEYHIRHRGQWGEWEPWEAIPLNIEGDNVVVARHNDRLFLFWLLIHPASSSPGKEGASFDAVHLSVAWSERTQEGWSRINISERSDAVAQVSETERFRLQFWNVGDEIHLLVLRWCFGVYPTAVFIYDTVAKHLYFDGASFDHNVPSNAPYLLPGGYLAHDRIIALEYNHWFEGQRYVKRPLKYPPTGARFYQGTFDDQVFNNNPEKTRVALIHQADIWDPGPITKFTPVVYDDRRHKYLLEPTQSPAQLGTQGEDLSPSKLGATDIASHLACTESTAPQPLVSAPSLPKARQIQDNLIIMKAFDVGGAPGQEPKLAEFSDVDSFNVIPGNEDALLEHGMSMMGGDIKYGNGNTVDSDVFWLKIEPLYHPFVHDLVHRLSRYGLAGIYEDKDYPRQLKTNHPLDDDGLDVVDSLVWGGVAPVEEFDFDIGSTYGVYNWEIFYHVPTLIADKLTTDQRFEEAQDWLHKIFDPIRVVEGEDGPEKFWRIKPFYEEAQALAQDQFEAMLGIGVSEAEQELQVADFNRQVDAWLANPFDPHAIARVRPGVYQRALLMQYFDNLIAWADNLFRRDSIESINEATMLYMLVAQLLGERPQEVPGPKGETKSYAALVSLGLDNLANAAVQLENWKVERAEPAKLLGCVTTSDPTVRRVNIPLRFWYFCYPPNPQMLAYWDIVEDRLWKIRNCQNIDGVVRQLALFQPPIDPALLVAATAAGVDLASALAQLDSGLPPYRFRYVWGRAQSITNELRSLGAALLSALEKRDGEELAALRAGQELSLLETIRQVRLRRIEEAAAAIEALEAAQNVLDHRRGYYAELIGTNAGDDVSEGEQNNLDKLEMAQKLQGSAQVHRTIAAIVGLFPNFQFGTGAFTDFGGSHLGSAVSAGAEFFSAMSGEFSYQASKALTNAQYERRRQEWEFQVESTDQEITRIEKDHAVAEIRLGIAQRELADHDVQVSNARDIERFMHDKYTDYELYDWMVGELSTLYFQTYQLAFDLAKRAERAYRHELAIREQAQPVIKYGYWDSLHKGLLVGERLAHDLARLDVAYMDKDVREYELRKSISLARLDPLQLLNLQETGECDINIPELAFDLDHPGHYLRRIRAVRLTIPAVVGPYTTLGATLQLVSHTTRVKADHIDYPIDDDRFVHGYGGGQAIATSTAVTDAGLFQLDFRDERYLPFEYAGAISLWKLRLPDPAKAPQFDYRTISDVIVHVDYTAREGGEDLRTAALNHAASVLESAPPGGGYQLLMVQDAFPNEWEKFLSPGVGQTTHALTLPITAGHFPYFAQRTGFTVDSIDVHLILAPSVSGTVTGTSIGFYDDAEAEPPGSPAPATFITGTYGNTIKASFGSLSASAQSWRLEIDTTQATIPAGLDPDQDGLIDRSVVAGMLLVVHYSLASNN